MKIHNPNKLPTVDYRDVNPLQGNLKDLTEERYKKLQTVLNQRGFTVPLFLWKDGDMFYLLDGHQRQIVMTESGMNDNGNFEVPYVLIDAKDIKDAKEQLLEITSQYGKLTYEGFDEFISEAEIPEAQIVETTHFDALYLYGQEKADKAKKRQLVTCPECSFESEINDFKKRYEEKIGD